MTHSATTTRSLVYDVHQKSGRAVIENRFTQRSRTAVALGSWEMMRAVGLPVRNCLLKEAELGAFMAMTMPIDVGYTRSLVANTSLGIDLNTLIATELNILHYFNRDYHYQARTFGGRIEFADISPSSAKEATNCLNQETGVTTTYLQKLLSEGYDIFPDRNDPRLAGLLDEPSLFAVTDSLNDKNEYYRFLRRRSITFSRPTAILINSIPMEILEGLLTLKENDSLSRFVDYLQSGKLDHEGAFDPTLNYFVKVSGGAGGNVAEMSMCRMHPVEENSEIFRGMLENLIRRMKDGVISRGIQLLAPIDARTPNTANPLDSKNVTSFSPCLTLRIGSRGNHAIGQIADQILANSVTWSGAYWHRKQHDEFVKAHADDIERLAHALSAEGYFGYFGTDFVQNTNGIYEMTVDGNARMNGNDWMHLVRVPLELQGVFVQDVYMSFLKFEADNRGFAEALEELCGEYRYTHLKLGGLTVWPSFNPDTYLGTSKVRKVALIYVNPSQDKKRFEKFLELVH